MGAMLSGNKTLVKPDTRGAPVVEALVRLFEASGMPPESLLLVNSDRECAERVFESCKDIFRIVQFTGSSKVAHKLLEQFKGKVKIEDSGFNWKILGPDVHLPEYVVSQADQDAFATSGQKCSCMRILLVHKNWAQTGFLDKLVARVKQRKLSDLTISPILSVSNEQIEARIAELQKIPGAKVLVGGQRVTESNNVPSIYGLFQPTIVSLPFSEVSKRENSELIFKELFGPLLIVTEYDTPELQKVIDVTEEIPFHLTAAVVSNDPAFVNFVAKNTVNGVTYVGVKARTTGAPQNHFFGPSNDPRGAGIGTPEAIINTWTCHREVIYDYGTFSDKPGPLPLS
jgi:1-pyrroline-5-carboxylate dehydrogenase